MNQAKNQSSFPTKLLIPVVAAAACLLLLIVGLTFLYSSYKANAYMYSHPLSKPFGFQAYAPQNSLENLRVVSSDLEVLTTMRHGLSWWQAVTQVGAYFYFDHNSGYMAERAGKGYGCPEAGVSGITCSYFTTTGDQNYSYTSENNVGNPATIATSEEVEFYKNGTVIDVTVTTKAGEALHSKAEWSNFIDSFTSTNTNQLKVKYVNTSGPHP